MGQYYRGVVVDNNEDNSKYEIVLSFCPYAHRNGAKLMEHSYVGNYYVKAFEYALSSVCYANRFAWVGDYADEVNGQDMYQLACKHIEETEKEVGTKYNAEVAFGLTLETLPTFKYIINFTKKTFVRIPPIDENQWAIHPLPLLCACGNNRGGGDYYGTNMSLIGEWAFDEIGVSNDIPDDITEELVVTFDEDSEGDNYYTIDIIK